MTKQIWLNLPVKDVQKAKMFFTKLGFSFNESQENDYSACMQVGEKDFVVMLFEESVFKKFVQNEISTTSSEILISIDAESRAEVDDFAQRVVEAGGVLFSKPAENQGWMYGFGFSDLDAHRWNVLYMDLVNLKNNLVRN